MNEFDGKICEICREKAITKVVFGCSQEGTNPYRPLYVCGKCINIVSKCVADLVRKLRAKS